MRSRLLTVLVLAALVAACSGEDPMVTSTDGSGADTAARAVELLIGYFEIPDFDAAASLAYPGQAALAALAEGASFAEVAEALRTDDPAVAANFWSGFAQGAGSFLTSEVTVTDGRPVTQDRIEFGVAEVESATVGWRTVHTRVSEGHRVDLFASFGAGIATRMIPSVERLLASQTEDSALILQELNRNVPSLVLASRHEWVPPTVALEVVRLIELITRAR